MSVPLVSSSIVSGVRSRGGNRPGARRPRRAAARVVTPRPRAARLYKPRRRQAAAASPRAAKVPTCTCVGAERPRAVQFWIRKTSPPLSTESRFENRDRTSSGWPRLQGLNFNLNLRFCCPGVRAQSHYLSLRALWTLELERVRSYYISVSIRDHFRVTPVREKSHD